MDKWKMFYHEGRRLGGYTVEGTFAGEEAATRELLAAENNLEPEEIKVVIENRPAKQRSDEPER